MSTATESTAATAGLRGVVAAQARSAMSTAKREF